MREKMINKIQFQFNKIKIKILNKIIDKLNYLKKFFAWGLGIGDWGLGIGDWAQSPIPNPQSPNTY